MKAPFLLNILWQSGRRVCNRWPHWNIELFYVNNGVKSHFSQTDQHCWNLSWLARYKAVKNAAWGSPRIGCQSNTGYFPPDILLGCPNSLMQGGTLLCDERHHNSKMSGRGTFQSIVNNLLPTASSLTAKSGVKLAICGLEGAPIRNSRRCSTSR